ncbi:MAG: hypothetical protein F6K09_18390 [Merismopedia sp. SIO2A8]|nr:hypothetical protein [Merismopedia sp. SIO2A8]
MTTLLTHHALAQLLQHRNACPSESHAIDAQIQAMMKRYAVMNLDMSGFSRLTIQHGITHFLAMIQRLVGIVVPIVNGQQGSVFKQEADNVFGVFLLSN